MIKTVRVSIILTFFVFINGNQLYGQLQFALQSSIGYMGVNSYMGQTTQNAYVLKFTYSGTNLNVPHWKISVRLLGPILATDGTHFPADKISFIPTITTGAAQPNPIPTFAEIGAPSNVPLSEGSEVFLVPQSNAPLYNVSQYGSYYYMNLNFNLQVAAGLYLQNMQGGNNQKKFTVRLEFRAYNNNNQIIGTFQSNYLIDVFRLIDTYQISPEYSIQLSGAMQNTLLEFKTKEDYALGRSITHQNGIIVSSNVDYQVSSKSAYPALNSIEGYSMPLNLVKIEPYLTSSNVIATSNAIWLSSSPQVIIDGESEENSPNAMFDVTYTVGSGSSSMMGIRMGTYSTVIIYEITPK